MEISRELAGCQSTIMPAGEKANELRNPNFFAGFAAFVQWNHLPALSHILRSYARDLSDNSVLQIICE